MQIEVRECLQSFSAESVPSSLLSKNLKIKIYRTKILSVVLYGCGTWSLTLRKEHRLRVFENSMLRRIFGPKMDEVTGEWRKLHNEENSYLYCSPNIIRVVQTKNEVVGACGVYRVQERFVQDFGE